MSINLDFSAVNTEPLAVGVYALNIDACEETVSSTGKPMIKVRFKEPNTGIAIFENYVIQDNTLWKLKELLDALGYDTSAGLDVEPLELVGQMVNASVVQREYEGSIQNSVKKVLK
jgi:hypothetical protein